MEQQNHGAEHKENPRELLIDSINSKNQDISRGVLANATAEVKKDLLILGLCYCCQRGNLALAEFFLKAGADPDTGRCGSKYPPLLLAARHRHHAIVQCLLQHGANPEVCGENFQTALMLTTDTPTLDALLRNGADLEATDENGYTPLLTALIRDADCKLACELIRNGASIGAADHRERSVLMTAVWKNHIRVIEELMDRNVDVGHTDHRKRNVFHHLASDLDRTDEPSPRQKRRKSKYSTDDNQKIIDILFRADPKGDHYQAKDELGRTPLHWAAVSGNSLLAAALIKHSKQLVDVRERKRRTPLHFAAANHNTRTMELLLANGANVDARTDVGLSPLQIACMNPSSRRETVSLLVEKHSANSAITTPRSHKTLVHLAAQAGNPDVIDYLVQQRHLDPVARDAFSNTPLLYAASHPPTNETDEERLRELELKADSLRHASAEENTDAASLPAPLTATKDAHAQDAEAAMKKAERLAAKQGRNKHRMASMIGHVGKQIDELRAELETRKRRRQRMVESFSPWHPARPLSEGTQHAARQFNAYVTDFRTKGNLQVRKPTVYDLLYSHVADDPKIATKNGAGSSRKTDRRPASNLAGAGRRSGPTAGTTAQSGQSGRKKPAVPAQPLATDGCGIPSIVVSGPSEDQRHKPVTEVLHAAGGDSTNPTAAVATSVPAQTKVNGSGAQHPDAGAAAPSSSPNATAKLATVTCSDLKDGCSFWPVEKISHPGSVSFRWIHLPANNVAWCLDLLTKDFVEKGGTDVHTFRTLERSFAHQHRGEELHARYMTPLCHTVSRSASTPAISEPAERHKAPPKLADQASGGLEELVQQSFRDHESRRESRSVTGNDWKEQERPRAGKRTAQHGSVSAATGTGPIMSKKQKRRLSHQHCAHAATKKTDRTTISSLYMFTPFLHFETLEDRTQMQRVATSIYEHHCTSSALSTSSSSSKSGKADTSSTSQRPLSVLDRHPGSALLRAYLMAPSFPLHMPRTLDQYFYHYINTTERDKDQVVHRFQDKQSRSRNSTQAPSQSNIKLLMVDQLWMWVLNDNLLVTSFPQRWKDSGDNSHEIVDDILLSLTSSSRDRVHNVYELATVVTSHCFGAFDRHRIGEYNLQFLDMFEGSLGNVLEREVKLFKKFDSDSQKASPYLISSARRALPGSQSLKLSRKEKDESRLYVELLFNISQETELLSEIKDIIDELTILNMIFECQQQQILPELIQATTDVAEQEHWGVNLRQKLRKDFNEQQRNINYPIQSVERMKKLANRIRHSVTDLLDLKQKHVNAIEARAAREQAASTASQGNILMIFTTFSVIFLPLSFIASFFTINISQFPQGNNGNLLSLAFVTKYMFGVGTPIAVVCVFLALWIDRIWEVILNDRWYIFWRRDRTVTESAGGTVGGIGQSQPISLQYQYQQQGLNSQQQQQQLQQQQQQQQDQQQQQQQHQHQHQPQQFLQPQLQQERQYSTALNPTDIFPMVKRADTFATIRSMSRTRTWWDEEKASPTISRVNSDLSTGLRRSLTP